MVSNFFKFLIFLSYGSTFINECFSQNKVINDELDNRFTKTYCLSDISKDSCEKELNKKMKEVRLYCYKLEKNKSTCDDKAKKTISLFLDDLNMKYRENRRGPSEDISKRSIRDKHNQNWNKFLKSSIKNINARFNWRDLAKKVKNEKESLVKKLESAREELKKIEKSKDKNAEEIEIVRKKEREAFEEVNKIEEIEENAENFVDNTLSLPTENSCDQEMANYVPFKLLKDLTWNKKGIDISVKTDPKTKKKELFVTMPDYIEKCFHPKVVVKKGEGNKILLAVKNLNQSINSGRSSGVKRRFEKCISDENINLEKPRGDHFHRPVNIKNYASHINLSDIDPSKDIRVVYGSPNNWNESPYKPESIKDKDKVIFRGEENRCLNGLVQENLKTGGLDLLGWKERKKELYDLCNKDLSFSSLTNVIKSLSDYPEELVSDVKVVLRAKLDKKSSEQMELLKEYSDEITNATSRDEAKESLENYLSILRDLDNFILKPSLRELETLIRKRSSSKSNRKRIDKRIEELNEIIGRFSKGQIIKDGPGKELNTKGVLKKLLFYGLEEGANEINLYRLHSAAFSRVYRKGSPRSDKEKKSGSRLTYKAASNFVKSGQMRFEKGSSFNSKLYKAMNGEKSFSHINRENIKNYQRRKQGMLKDFYKKENKYASYCQRTFFGFIKNANKCKRFQEGQSSRYRRIQSMIGGIDKKINSERSIEAQFRSLESKAREKKREELGRSFRKIEDKAFSDSLFEDDFMEGIYKERLSFFGDISEADDPLKLFKSNNNQGQGFPPSYPSYPQSINSPQLGFGNLMGGYYSPSLGMPNYGMPSNSSFNMR